MTDKIIAPYGSWKSPVTSELIVADSVSIGDVTLHGDDIYWTEMRPADNARSVIVRRTPDGRLHDLTPPGYSARTRVHEYGGGAFCVSGAAGGGSVVYFSNFSDQRVYRQTLSPHPSPLPGGEGEYVEVGEPQPLTPEIDMRYADGEVCERRNMMVCVREDHSSLWREAVNTIVAIDLERGGSRVLVSGASFYSSPRISPDGSMLAWLSWNHPNMPWDGCELWVAELLDDGSLGERRLVAGGVDESIFQPSWSPGGALYFVSDRSGWWNIYRAGADFGSVEPVCEMEAEFGRPAWVFGLGTYGFASDERIICAYTQSGDWHIGDIDTTAGTLTTVPTPFTDIGTLHLNARHVAFTAGSPTMPMSLMRHDLTDSSTTRLRSSSAATLDDGYISHAQAIEFPTENGLTAHAFYYPPTNGDYAAPEGEKPPLIVISHGGPTSAADSSLDLRKQFWTSRGFGVLDVNYGGSSGFGTEYRRRLNDNWGIVDVDDCINGANYLVEQGLADADRLIIRGGSAGGLHYTSRAHHSRHLQRGRELLRHQRTRGDDTGHPQVRVALSGWADRALPGAGRALPRALAHQSHRRLVRADDCAARAGRQDRAAEPSRVDGERAAREGPARRLPDIRGRAAWFPAGSEYPARAGGGAVLLLARVRVRPGR